MRNIWRIFKRDVCHVTRNVIAIIVAMGLIVVPSLYAWYNIAASWDPYGNTKSLKVAVANVDDGYKSDLMPIRINVGETVTNALRANHDLDWQFVDRDQAIDGVNSGDYYAALVIPATFSADMMTLFEPQITHAKLEYYLNEKINPIAPHITDQGATTVTTTIDQTFAKTLGEVALDMASSIVDYADSPQMAQYVDNATAHLQTMSQGLTSAATQTDAYAQLIGSVAGIIASTDRLLGSTGSSADDVRQAITQGKDSVGDLETALSGVADGIGAALTQASGAYEQISDQIDEAFAAIGSQSGQAAGALTDLQSAVSAQAEAFAGYEDTLRSLAAEESLSAVRRALESAADQAASASAALDEAATALGDAATRLADGTDGIDDIRDDLKAQITQAGQSVAALADTYRQTLEPQLDSLADALSDVAAQTGGVIDGLALTADGVSSLSGDITDLLSTVRASLTDASTSLTSSAGKLDRLSATLTSAVSGGGTDLSALTDAEPDEIATLLSAPVAVNRVAVYPVENYGSAMAPFYTILAIWVGAVILVAMLKVTISDRQKAKVLGLGDSLPLGGPGHVRPESAGNARRFGLRLHHEYFGRYLIFMVFALLQSTLICLGDLLYLGVQCAHPLQFMMVGWLAAIVFSNLVYTLTVSFGDIGKAVAVLLLVMQVAGSGGSFPIETLPPVFQTISKFLLFPPALDAMHAAMAGSYGAEYWVAMGRLALFLIPSLLLGLLLRKPVIRLNDWIGRNLERTKVM